MNIDSKNMKDYTADNTMKDIQKGDAMKKRLFLLALFGALFLSFSAPAEAADISAGVTFSASSNKGTLGRLKDGKYDKAWSGSKGKGSLDISSDVPMHGLYIAWEQEPRAFTIESDGKAIARYGESSYIHQYYPLSGERHVRLVPENDNGKNFAFKEVFVLGEGSLPSWVQLWEPTVEDADLMLLFAHPDDEVLYFGGLLPYYGAERGLSVLPVVLTNAGSMRQSELLNCLWSLGIRNYPVTGPFPDLYARDLDHAYERNGKRKSNDFIIELVRRYKPEVIVTHDVRGEYGHGVHRLCADLVKKVVAWADDPERHPASFETYGAFRVQKVYLHLYSEKGNDVSLEMDWDQPLSAFGGKTGFELAVEAYANFHLSQHRYTQFHVEPREGRYSCYRFGLYYSAVGPDVLKNDLMENIPLN